MSLIYHEMTAEARLNNAIPLQRSFRMCHANSVKYRHLHIQYKSGLEKVTYKVNDNSQCSLISENYNMSSLVTSEVSPSFPNFTKYTFENALLSI